MTEKSGASPETVEEALALTHETQEKLKQAEQILTLLTDAGVRKPAVLSDLVGPTLRIRDTLLKELELLDDLAKQIEQKKH